MSTAGPALHDGEEVMFDHIPSLKSYRRAALLLLAISLLPTIVFAAVFEDSYWVIAPMFLTSMLLVQERFTFGRHRAWITNQRIILQKDEVALGDIQSVAPKRAYVTVRHSGDGKSLLLYYPEDALALTSAITSARQANL